MFFRGSNPIGFSSFSAEDSDSEGDVEIRPEDHVFVAASCDELGNWGEGELLGRWRTKSWEYGYGSIPMKIPFLVG